MQISRIRLSDKTSRLRLRHVAFQSGQTNETQRLVEVSSDAWQEVCRALIRDVEDFVAKNEAELCEGPETDKTFQA